MQAVKDGLARICRINLSGKWGPDAIQPHHFHQFPMLVISSRAPFEHPGLLAALTMANPDQLLMIYYSAADAPYDWQDHPHTSFEWKIGDLATRGAHWMPQADQPIRIRGRVPVTRFWGALLNMTRPQLGEGWAKCVRDHHLQLESMAGKQLGLFIDNAWDDVAWVNSLPGNEAGADSDLDGTRDEDTFLRGEWKKGTAHALSCLRLLMGDRVMIGNGQSTFTKQLNGMMWEDLGGISWMDPWTVLSSPDSLAAADAFRKPIHHIIHVTHPRWAFGVTAAHLWPHAWVAFSEEWSVHSSIFWEDPMGWNFGQCGSGDIFEDGDWLVKEYEYAFMACKARGGLSGKVVMKSGLEWPPPVLGIPDPDMQGMNGGD